MSVGKCIRRTQREQMLDGLTKWLEEGQGGSEAWDRDA